MTKTKTKHSTQQIQTEEDSEDEIIITFAKISRAGLIIGCQMHAITLR